jgi:uncharacterized protein YbjT (DUF2867 family)
MPKIAISGGTSPGLGRSIVTALSNSPANQITILSRKTSKQPNWLEDFLGTGKVEVVGVDYEDEEGLADVLRRRGVQIVSFNFLLEVSQGPEGVCLIASCRQSLMRLQRKNPQFLRTDCGFHYPARVF